MNHLFSIYKYYLYQLNFVLSLFLLYESHTTRQKSQVHYLHVNKVKVCRSSQVCFADYRNHGWDDRLRQRGWAPRMEQELFQRLEDRLHSACINQARRSGAWTWYINTYTLSCTVGRAPKNLANGYSSWRPAGQKMTMPKWRSRSGARSCDKQRRS